MVKVRGLLKYRGLKAFQIHDMHVTMLAIFYVLLAASAACKPLQAVALISAFYFYFLFGFLINDFFDMPHDIAAGKKRAVQELPKRTFITIIISVVLISVLHIIYLKSLLFTALYSLSFALATLYSAPFGFKRKGFFGIIVNSLIEKALPVLAVFSFFNHFGTDMLVFVSTAFALQMVEILTHQIYDYESDKAEGIRTFVVGIGRENALKIYRFFVVPTCITLILLTCYFIYMKIPFVIFIIATVIFAYAVLFVLISGEKVNTEEKVFPFYLSPLYFLINNAFPTFLAFVLAFRSFSYIPLLLLAFASQCYLVGKVFRVVREKSIPRTEIEDN